MPEGSGRHSTVQDELNRHALVDINKRLSALEGKMVALETAVSDVQETMQRLHLLVDQLVRALDQDDNP